MAYYTRTIFDLFMAFYLVLFMMSNSRCYS